MAAEVSIESRLCQLHQRLKQEKLFVNKEKAAILNLNTDILSSFEGLYHLSWITRQQWKIAQRVRASPEECSQVVNRLDAARFVDASRHLGYLESKYWEFLRSLRENPRLVASTLAYADRINLDTSLLIRLLLNSLYGNCLLQVDEKYVLLMMKHLMELKITGNGDPEIFSHHHRNSFTSLFGILVESLFSTKLYLTAALHAPIMQVLSEDSLFKNRLPRQCTKFVENLEAKLYCFPQSLRWIVCQFSDILSSSGKFSEKKSRSMVLKLLFDFLVCPAIIRPEQFGITSDVQISEIALQNLQQIASCLLCICSAEGENARPNLDMFSRIDQACITSFLDAILAGQRTTPGCPTVESPPGLCRNSVLITENELHGLTSFLRMVEHSEDCGDLVNQEELKSLLDKLPPPPDPPESTELMPPKELAHEMGLNAIGSNSPGVSPKSKHKGGPFKRKEKHHKHSPIEVHTPEMERTPETKIVKKFNPFAVENRSEGFKKECLRRLSVMFQEDEDVLIISLGYSAIECPGMLSEEKVLGINKPKKKVEAEETFRQRSSSSTFYKNINTIMKKDKEQSSNEDEDGEEGGDSDDETGELKHTVIDKKRQTRDLHSSSDGSHARQLTSAIPEMGQLDLLHSTGDAIVPQSAAEIRTYAGPDVVERGAAGKSGQSDSVDLIDFGAEFAQPVSVMPGEGGHAPPTVESVHLLDLHPSSTAGSRDSAISTSSSARSSAISMSSTSTRSSGLEFHKDVNSLVDSGCGDIPEEQSAEHLGTTAEGFRNRASLVVPDSKRLSKISSSRGSTSSETINGFAGEGSNRDSQASYLSFDMEFPPRTSSSSTADDEREVDQQRFKEKKTSRAASLKRRLISRKKKKSKEHRKDSFTDENDFSEKFDKGMATSTLKASKKSGAKVYEKLAEKSIEALDITKVDEKTPKDIEKILEKYMVKAAESTGQPVVGGDEEDSEEEYDDFLDEDEKFENAKRKLRLVLCQADFGSLPWLFSDGRVSGRRVELKSTGQELMTFLHMQLAEAINLQDRSLSAQLHETIRSVRELPQESYSKLLDTLEEEYKARSPYLTYLIKAHQGLLSTHAHLERLVERVERDKVICRNYFTMTCVKLFLESKVKGEINAFCLEFQSLPTADEKSFLLEDFLQKLAVEMESHPIWSGVSQDQLQDTFVATERAIMSIIYKYALYPNGEIDMQIDKTFHEHVTNLQKVVHHNHKAVRVPKVYRKEAPWESAQKELLKINAYKTPTDKLKCIQRSCTTIMNLLCLASETSVPGADEFMPALVYVVIHANPPSLLSTVQYVTNFYDKRLCGETAYFYMQFCAAIAFIKTLS